MERDVQLPLTKEFVKQLKVGDVLYLSGYVYNVPIVMDSLVGSIESDMGIKAT